MVREAQMLTEIDRIEFGARQAKMTARWFEGVKARQGGVDAYIAGRCLAYLDRWKEASRFISSGSRVLDIGGGHLFGSLIEFLKARDFRYAYLDVDPLCVDGSRALAQSLDLQGATFSRGYNDVLPFESQCFDAVFSSHCLEHSFDLASTFRELNRVIAPNGNLLMAVPFGWEANPEHPYIFAPDDWISIVTDAGFRIRTAQIGREYAEMGYDYFIAAQKISSPATFRLDPDDYTKAKFTFVPSDDPRIVFHGNRVVNRDHVIMYGEDWRIHIAIPEGAREVLPLFHRHDWSGIAQLCWASQRMTADLYSWFPFVQPCRVDASGASSLEISCAGRNPLSHSSQCVLFGALLR
jgi:SAM-dependent methyltransferase